MILRRLIEHVKAQNWTAVALDFVIVVSGVFIGIQVANWNEAREEAAQEHDILAGIAQDLRSDRQELQTGAASVLASIGASKYVLAEIGEPRIELLVPPRAGRSAGGAAAILEPVELETVDPDTDQKDNLWALSIGAFYPTGGVAAFDALTNTGKLGIIKDPDLISALQDYRQTWRGLDETQAGTMRPIRNDAISVGQRYGLSFLTAFPEEEFLRRMKEHEELRAVLRNQIAFKALHYRIITDLDDQAEAILAMLESKGVQP